MKRSRDQIESTANEIKKRKVTDDILKSDVFVNYKDRKAYQEKYEAIKESTLIKDNSIPNGIIKNIAEYGNGALLSCWKCDETITFTYEEVEDEMAKPCESQTCTAMIYGWECWMGKRHLITISDAEGLKCPHCKFQVCEKHMKTCDECGATVCESCWMNSFDKCWECFWIDGGVQGHVTCVKWDRN